jgi:CHASE3 domain sensor protein
MLSYSGVYSFDASAREFDMKNTALFLVMGIIYALSSDMDYLDAEMMRRNSQDVIATTPQVGEPSWVTLALAEQKNPAPRP